MNTRNWRLALAATILLVSIGCDQATKRIATATLRGAAPRSYCAGIVRLDYALNPGGFLSLGSQLAPRARFLLFVGANLVLMSGIAVTLWRHWNRRLLGFVALTLILAGGIGNLIDRVAQQGYVTDFIHLGLGPLRTGIFNVADVAVTAGAIALALSTFLPSALPREG